MSNPTDSPSLILQTYLIAQGLFVAPNVGAWPLFISHLPDGEDVDDNAGGIFDDAPFLDGRVMQGENTQHYGLQVKIRSIDYETGWLKGKAILDDFESIAKETIVVGSNTYTLWSISAKSGVVFMGTEQGTKRRYMFETNWSITISEN